MARASMSFSKDRAATPDLEVCILAPPSSSLVTSSLVTSSLVTVLTSHKHVGGILDHESEVSEGRRVHGTTNTGAHDHRELRDHSRGVDIALEDLCVAGERFNTLLNASASRVIETNNWGSHKHGLVHNLSSPHPTPGQMGGSTSWKQ